MKGYVGIPFVDGGRTIEGCDCWGLVRLVLLREKGIEVPSYAEIGARQLLAIARAVVHATSSGEVWNPVGHLPRREFDVVVMKSLSHAEKMPYHVGIMASEKKLLHTVNAADSHFVPIDHASVKSRIIGFYRHKDLP